jgi:hypothetical protein
MRSYGSRGERVPCHSNHYHCYSADILRFPRIQIMRIIKQISSYFLWQYSEYSFKLAKKYLDNYVSN